MNDVFGKLTDILVFCMVGFILPAFLTTFLMEEVKDTTASITVRELAEDVAVKGYLDKERYEAFLLELNAAGVITETEIYAEHDLLAPEYKMRSIEDMESYLESLWSGSNILNQQPMTTQRPSVTDPGTPPAGSLIGNVTGSDTETAGPNENHTHGAECYLGTQHRHDTTCDGYDVACDAGCTKHTHSGSSYSGTGCYSGGTYHPSDSWVCGTISGFHDETYTSYCSSCGNNSAVTNISLGGVCGNCHGSSFYSYMSQSCPCGYSYTYSPGTVHVVSTSAYYDLNCTKTEVEYYDSSGRLCSVCDGDGIITALACTKTDGGYYFIDGSSCSPLCGEVVTELIPVMKEQVLNAGESVDVRVKAVFADGHSEVVTAVMTGFNAGSYNTVQTVTLSYGEYAGSLDNAQAATCTAERLVRYPTKTCAHGHLYYLVSGNSTPCPYCAAYPKTIAVQGVEETPFRIRKGSTLRDNGVFLKVTYYDGRTEIVRSGFTDTLDKNYVGEQTVTIGYGGATTTLLVYTGRIKVNCSVCGYEYQLYPDDTDPGCSKCLAAVPEFTGNVLRYKETVSYGEILDELYYGDGICYFSRGDRFEIELWKNSDNMSGIALGRIFHAEMPKELVAMYGVKIRDEETEK